MSLLLHISFLTHFYDAPYWFNVGRSGTYPVFGQNSSTVFESYKKHFCMLLFKWRNTNVNLHTAVYARVYYIVKVPNIDVKCLHAAVKIVGFL